MSLKKQNKIHNYVTFSYFCRHIATLNNKLNVKVCEKTKNLV
jgi:hypothetical protein